MLDKYIFLYFFSSIFIFLSLKNIHEFKNNLNFIFLNIEKSEKNLNFFRFFKTIQAE